MFVFGLASLPFLLMGALAPSPAFDQYFYPLAPFLVLGTLAWFAWILEKTARLRWFGAVAAALAGVSAALAVRQYDDHGELTRPSRWTPSQMRTEALEIRSAVPHGKVLTLAPSVPLEAGLKIYPEFVTGPFAWRTARFVAESRRADLKLGGPDDLAEFFAADRPGAILTGVEKAKLEAPLIQIAQQHGYRRVKLSIKTNLWVAPTASP